MRIVQLQKSLWERHELQNILMSLTANRPFITVILVLFWISYLHRTLVVRNSLLWIGLWCFCSCRLHQNPELDVCLSNSETVVNSYIKETHSSHQIFYALMSITFRHFESVSVNLGCFMCCSCFDLFIFMIHISSRFLKCTFLWLSHLEISALGDQTQLLKYVKVRASASLLQCNQLKWLLQFCVNDVIGRLAYVLIAN